ncbi:unnamed protein product [Paramecium sonneborni]|uniref:NACHT domain-containing protein n=1 Tax=Paramecium sonneborni TaxID=65129 RepID=A0A8S1MBV3_9CILI|nr:unnamed protein product [Paramecium sonneborni]
MLDKMTKCKHFMISDKSGNNMNKCKSSQFQNQYNKYQSQQLRGGGCIMSSCRSGQQNQEPEMPNEAPQVQLDLIQTEKQTEFEKELPQNFSTDFDDSVSEIEKGFSDLSNNSVKNKVILRIQWFSYNKNIFNNISNQSTINTDLKNKINDNLNKLLDVLPNYLDVSWFLCYQIAQICNDLLRILYSHQLDDSNDILEKVKNFSESIKNGSDNIWKGGLEFEKTLMEIMLNNCSHPGEELDLLKEVAMDAGKSILKAFKKEQNTYLKKQQRQSYIQFKYIKLIIYFKHIKWRIIEQDSQSVYSSIQTLKGLFQKYIQESKNWILHFCWIQTITDIILYRPIIEQEQLSKDNLQEKIMFQKLAFDNKKAIILFFNQESDQILNQIYSKYRKNELQLLCQNIIDEQFAQNKKLWDYYCNFHFINKQEDAEQHNLIQVNREQELLKKLFEQLKALVIQIRQTQNEISANQEVIPKQLFEDHKNKLFSKFFDLWKKAIYIMNIIIDFLNFDFEKIKLTKNQQKFEDQQKIVQKFVQEEFPNFQRDFLYGFLEAISYYELKEKEKQEDNEMDKQKNTKIFSLDENQLSDSFDNFLNAINQLQKEVDSQDHNEVKIENLNEFFIQIIQGFWIRQIQIALKQDFQLNDDELKDIEKIREQVILCQIKITTINFLSQFMKFKLRRQKGQKENFKCIKIKDSFKKRFIGILKKHIDNLTSLKVNLDKDFNVDVIKSNFELIDSEIDFDIKTIKIEKQAIQRKIQKLERKEKDKSELKNKLAFLMKVAQLLHNFQGLFIIFVNQIEQPDKNLQVQSDKNCSSVEKYKEDFKMKNNQLLDDLKAMIEKIEGEKDSDSQNHEFLDFQILYCDIWSSKYQTINDQIKSVMKFYQSYQKLLLIYLDSFFYQINDQSEQNEKDEKDQFILKIKEFKNNNLEFVNDLEQQIEISLNEIKKEGQIYIENNSTKNQLSLIQFLTFFEMDYEMENEAEDEINIAVLQEIKNQIQQKINLVVDFIEAKDYKVGECLVYNLIRLQNSNLEDQIINFASQTIQKMWVYEKDQRVRNLLKNKELIEMQKLIFSRDIQTMSDQIKQEIQQRMQNLENLQQQIRLQGNFQEREKLQEQLRLCYQQLDESIDNVSEMSDAMNITLMFLKDISKDVKSIKTSIDNLQNSLQDIGNDIRKLRGKKYGELLEIRKQKILYQAQHQEIDSIYVKLKTTERNPFDGSSKPGSFLLQEDIKDYGGEVNEFIWHDNIKDQGNEKDVMLLSGFAGSGKSRAAKKIEEFLWKSQGTQSEWIPIYVSLPTLKNPKYNLLDQALESENYQFDKYQIKEFKDAICKQKVKVVLILDSYDEMKQDCVQQNLIMTNKLIQDLNIQKFERQLKIIITTRREILNTDGYETWFYGESLETLKEVQLLNFDQDQQDEYLEKYCELSIKRIIKQIYEFVKQVQEQAFDLVEFLKIWSSILIQVKQSLSNSKKIESDSIFNNKEEEIIIKKIKSQQVFQFLSDEQITGLRKDLLSLWSINKFQKSINSVNIQNLLTTPFMLEIIVQVLPSMTKKYQGSVKIKENFRQNYISMNKRAKQSRNQIQQFQKQMEEQTKKKHNRQEKNQQSVVKSSKIKKTQKKKKIDDIMDQLENIQFFQNFSIDSNIQYLEEYFNSEGQKLLLNINNIDIVLMALKIKKLTVFEFYESFISYYHEQQIIKQRELGKISNYESFALDMYQFSSSLALDMTIRDMSQISYKQKGQLLLQSNFKATQEVDNWLDQYLSDSYSDKEYKKLIRSCILLSAKGSSYSFTHKSIQEFFVAQFIYNFLLSLVENQKPENFDYVKTSLFNQNYFNVSHEAFRGAHYFIKDKLLSIGNIDQKMIDIIKLSKNQDFCRAASNSINILSQMNVYLGSQDFSQINLADTNISGLSFFECYFSNSIFQNVIISSCNFNEADLSDINWDVTCKEKPYLVGPKQCYDALAISPDGKYIASGGKEGIVKLWNPQNYTAIKDFNGQSCITQLQFSSDSQLLISLNSVGTIIFSNMRDLQFTQKEAIIPDKNGKIKQFQLSQDYQQMFILTQSEFIIKDFDQLFQVEESQYESEIIKKNLESLYERFPNFAKLNENFIIDLTQTEKYMDKIEKDTKNITFSQDRNYMATLNGLQQIKIWELETNLCTVIQTDYNIYSIQFTSDSKSLIMQGRKMISFSEINSLKNKKEIIKKSKCQEICISPINNQIIAIAIENAIETINIQTQNLLKRREFEFQPRKIIISLDGQSIALMLLQNNYKNVQFQILEFETLKTKINIEWDPIRWVSYFLSEDLSRMFISLNINSDEYLHTLKTFELNLQIMNYKRQSQFKEYLIADIFCIKPKSQIIAYVQNEKKGIILFNIENQKQIGNELSNQENQVVALCFSPTQNILAAFYQDSQAYQVLIWNLDTQKASNLDNKMLKNETFLLRPLTSLTFSPNGNILIVSFLSTLQIYILKSESWVFNKSLDNYNISDNQIYFSLDSKFLPIIDSNQFVYILDVEDDYKQKNSFEIKNTFNMIFTLDNNIQIFITDHSLILFNISTKKIEKEKKFDLKISQTSVSQNKCEIAVVLSEQQSSISSIIQFWSYQNNDFELIGSKIFLGYITYVCFINNDKELLLQCLNDDNEKIIGVYQKSQFIYKNFLNEGFNCGTFSKSNQLIALAVNAKAIHILTSQLDYFSDISLNQTDYPDFVLFIQNDQILVQGNTNGVFKFWNIKNNELLKIKWIQNQSLLLCMEKEGILEIQQTSCLESENQEDQIVNQQKIELGEQSKIEFKIIGYYENINDFSSSQDGENIIGIFNNQQILNLNRYNFEFCSSEDIKKIQLTFCGKFLIILTTNYNLIILNKDSQFQKLHQKEQVYDFDLHPKMNLLAISTYGVIELFKISDIKMEAIFSIDLTIDFFWPQQGEQQNLKFTENGQILVFIVNQRDIRWYQVYESKTLKALGFKPYKPSEKIYLTYSKHLAYIQFIQIYSGYGGQRIINILNIEKQNAQIPFSNHPQQFSLSQDEQIVYILSSQEIYKFDIQQMVTKEITKNKNYFHIQAADNNSLIVIRQQEMESIIEYWNESGNSEIGKSKNTVLGSSFFPQQQLLALTFEKNQIIQLWNIKAKKIISNLQGHRQKINSLAFSTDGLILATASDDQSIRLWNIDFNEQIDPSVGHREQVRIIAFSKDGFLIASGSHDQTIILWDLLEKKFLNQLEDHSGSINCLEFSYCSKFLYSGSEDMSVRIWDIENPRQSKIINILIYDFPVTQTCLSPINPNVIAINYNNALQFINKEDIQEAFPFLPKASCLCFTNNDDLIYLIETNEESQLLIYDINNKKSQLIQMYKKQNFPQQILSLKNNKELFVLRQLDVQENISLLQQDQNNKWINNPNLSLPIAQQIMLSPEKQTLVLENSTTLTFWRVEFLKGNILYEYKVPQNLKFLTISVDCTLALFLDEYCEQQNKQKNIKLKLVDLKNKNFDKYRSFVWEVKFQKLDGYFDDFCLSFDVKYLVAYENFYSYSKGKTRSILHYLELERPEKIQKILKEENESYLITFRFSTVDSHFIYAAYKNGKIIEWNLQTGASKILFSYQNQDIFNVFNNLQFSPQFNYLVLKEKQIGYFQEKIQLKLYDRKQQINIDILQCKKDVNVINFSEDERLVAFSNNEQLWLCSFSNSNLIEQDKFQLVEREYAQQIRFYQNILLLAQKKDSDLLYIFEIQPNLKLKIKDCVQIKVKISDFNYNLVQQQLIIFGEKQIILYQIQNRIIGEPIQFENKPKDEIIDPSNQVYCFSPDEEYFALLTNNSSEKKQLSLRNTITFEEKMQPIEIEGHTLAFQKLNEKLLLAISNENNLSFFSIKNNLEKVKTFTFEKKILSFQLTSQYLLINFSTRVLNEIEESILIYQIKSLENNLIKQDILRGITGIISKNNKYLAYINRKNTKILKMYNKIHFQTEGQNQKFNLISFSSNGKYLALYKNEYVKCDQYFYSLPKEITIVLIIDSESLEIKQSLQYGEKVTFIDISVNWKYIAYYNDKNIQIDEITNYFEFKTSKKLPLTENDQCSAISLSSKGNYLVSGNWNQENSESKIFLWDVNQNKLIAQSGNLDSLLSYIKFCPDDITFAAALESSPLHLYQIKKSDQEIKIQCYKSIARYSTILAHQSILSTKSKVEKSQNSIKELFIQKGAIQKNN